MLQLTSQHRRACEASHASFVHPSKSLHDVFVIDTSFPSLIQLVSEDVEHQFTIALGIYVSVGLDVEEMLEFGRVDQVAILNKIR